MNVIHRQRRPVPLRQNLLMPIGRRHKTALPVIRKPVDKLLMPIGRRHKRTLPVVRKPVDKLLMPTGHIKRALPIVRKSGLSKSRVDAADRQIVKAVEEKLAADKEHTKQQLNKKIQETQKTLVNAKEKLQLHETSRPPNPDTLPQNQDLDGHYERFNAHKSTELDLKDKNKVIEDKLKNLQKQASQQGGRRRRKRHTKRKIPFKKRYTKIRRKSRKRRHTRKHKRKRRRKTKRKFFDIFFPLK